MSTIGAKFQSIPEPAASKAATSLVRRVSSGSKLAASATGTGKTVRWPWMMSAAKISGIFIRDSFTATFCMVLAMRAPLPLKIPVSWPCRVSSSWRGKLLSFGGLRAMAALGPQADAIRLSCPAFSSIVMRAISDSMNAGVSRWPAACSSARAGLAIQATTVPAPISAARREMRVSSIQSLLVRLAAAITGSPSMASEAHLRAPAVTGYMTA